MAEENMEQGKQSIFGTPKRKIVWSDETLLLSSPRFIRKEAEDGSMEEFQMTRPVVRHSKLLAFRRCSSVVGNSSQFDVYSPPAKKRRLDWTYRPSPHQGLQDELLSEGSCSGPESIEMEDDTARDEVLGSHATHNTSDQGHHSAPVSNARPVDPGQPSVGLQLASQDPCKQNEPKVVERPLKLSKKDMELIQGKENEKDQEEFKIHRRWPDKLKHKSGNRSDTDPNTLTRTLLHRPSNHEEQHIRAAAETFIGLDDNVISDGTKAYALPCVKRTTEEFMYISCDTLADVLRGQYDHILDVYKIIDCRYPYEYNGGHITGALNMWQADRIGEVLTWKNEHNGKKRIVLIFYCEFSAQRSPSIMRLLRRMDRKLNADSYPHLCYPEIYLLDGGYYKFFGKHFHLCEPQFYIPKEHPNFVQEQNRYDERSTSWHGRGRPSRDDHTLVL